MPREAADVHLIDDCFRKRVIGRTVTFPVIGAEVRDDALHRLRSVVSRTTGWGAVVAVGDHQSPTVGVEEHFVRVVPQTPHGIMGPAGSIGVDLADLQTRHKDVPIVKRSVSCVFERDHAGRARILGAVE